MASTHARTHESIIEIPGELHDALGRPRRIVLTPSPDGSLVLRAQRLRNQVGEPARRLLGRGSSSLVARLVHHGDPAVFRARTKLGDGKYGIANYDVSYALLPIGTSPEANSRQMFWSGVVILGLILPLLAVTTGAIEYRVLAVLTSLSALAGLFLWEHIWVQAGQAVPLS